MSEKLQDWLFSQYTVSNALGERRTIKDIFKAKGLVPPGGTGECAAPKLLQFAYSHRLKDFFTENYPEPIVEGGVTLRDMLYFRRELG